MKKASIKKHIKELIAIICILLLIIIFGIKLYQEAQYEREDQKEIQEYEAMISKKNNEVRGFKKQAVQQDEEKKGVYNKPYIPKGFHYVEGTWNNGYVIEDEQANQFVWVPCRAYINDEVLELKRYDFNVKESLTVGECFENLNNIKGFIHSVAMYEGFYIARYEAGKVGENLVSKKEVDVWTNVSYPEAIELASNMYKDNDGISSSLISSLAWDTTLKWIDRTTNSKYSSKGSDTGNYTATIEKTGYDERNHIYDLSGNAWEWTTERCYEYPVYRGGYNYFSEDTKGPAGYRDVIAEQNKFYNIGFRVVLYAE